MKVLKVPVIDGEPRWTRGSWDHQGIPSRYTEQLCTVEVRFVVQGGKTVGIKKFLWVSDNVKVRGDSFRYERLGYRPSSHIGGMAGGEPWMLLEIESLGLLLHSALRAVDEAAWKSRVPSAVETQLREELEEAEDDRDHYRSQLVRLERDIEQLQGYIGELLSDK